MSHFDLYKGFMAEVIHSYEEMIRALSVFRRLAEGLGRKFTVREICEEVVNILFEELHLENCSIMLLEGDRLRIEVGKGEGSGRSETSLKVGEGIAGRALKEGRPIVVNDVDRDKDFLKLPTFVRIGSLLTIPIYGSTPKGVINMSHSRKNFFNPRQVDVLSLLSLIVGILIEFAEEEERLEAKVRERTQELEEMKSYFEEILNSASDLILTVERDGRIAFANKSIEDFGFDIRELRGKPYALLTGIPLNRGRLNSLLKEGLLMLEVEIETPLRGVRRFSCNLSTIRKGRRILYFLVVARDVTEKRKVEQTMRFMERLATLGEIAAGIAHEINNRLVPVVGYAEMLMGRAGDERERRMLKMIHDSAIGCKSIVQSLLEFAREKEPRKVPTDLNQLVEKTLSLFLYKLGGRGVKCVKRLTPTIPPVAVDPHQIEQVLINLINNAIHAMKGGGTLTVSTGYGEGAVTVKVEDTGCGIPPHILNRIFDPFFTTKEPGKGTGLGLSVSYGIVRSHGGTIEVKSEVGRGTTFTITLPLGHSEEVDGKKRGKGQTVLVVDDDPMVGEMIKEALIAGGYRVRYISDPVDSLNFLKDADLVIMDIMMPGLDGRELYRIVTEVRPELKGRVIFITGNLVGLEKGLKDFLDATGAPFLQKPFGPSELIRVIQRCAGKR